eukprot:634217-Prymnesium_polylepis.1
MFESAPRPRAAVLPCLMHARSVRAYSRLSNERAARFRRAARAVRRVRVCGSQQVEQGALPVPRGHQAELQADARQVQDHRNQ